MITLTQEKQIQQYLLSKKLNHKLFIEIKDHFIQQISTLMEEQQSNFDEAFQNTKISWKQELEAVKADLFSFRKITKIEKEILQKRFKNIMLYALVFALILFSFIFTVSVSNVFMYSEIALIGAMILLLAYNIIFRKMRLYHYVQLSFHPLILKNALAGIVLFTSVYFLYDNMMVVGSGIMKFFFSYAMAVKIQLLYYKARKTSVLI
ncbi:Uncharacterised protein [Chryseobacterium nakagawai]|uniref:Uncharacterized protein n=1 Tax=Chryseobacterium nakagawai TaxID=1241982 RepID=A0AAD0YLW5_CHRNA|nr:hypothetical protein [Chryseobacterium nakagawai]AZA91304.1 hypothetical protein EG343_11985 [Chryseobacterium nakagawai]VEH22878.1 Uncharacterised protein [Chryseobacterium nakagawai]